jgi:transcriptional regulator with XRE-family HTH domain
MAWMHQLGEEIAKARRRAGLTQAELGDKVAEARRESGLAGANGAAGERVSRQTIGLYERGQTPPPFETLACIAAVLKAEQFVVEDLHVTFNRNGATKGPMPIPHQLDLVFDKNGGVTVRIEPASDKVTIKAVPA